MICDQCGRDSMIVLDSRPMESGRRRRYRCLNCERRITTYELPADRLAEVRRRAEAFERVRRLAERLAEGR